jgi:hypothetical protein
VLHVFQGWVEAEDIIKLAPKPFNGENYVIAVDGKERPLISWRPVAKLKEVG